MTEKPTSLNLKISERLNLLKQFYNTNFDNLWFSILLRQCSGDESKTDRIRHMLGVDFTATWSLPVIYNGLEALEEYLDIIENEILPQARKLIYSPNMHVSGMSADEKLRRKLFLYVLPLNVNTMKNHLSGVKEVLPCISESAPNNSLKLWRSVGFPHNRSLKTVRRV